MCVVAVEGTLLHRVHGVKDAEQANDTVEKPLLKLPIGDRSIICAFGLLLNQN